MSTSLLQDLEVIVQPFVGLFSQVNQIPVHSGDPRFCIMSSTLGDISQVLTNVQPLLQGKPAILDGAGSGLEHDSVKLKALAEGLERYSCCTYHEKQFIWATAEELGTTALDLNTIACCSKQELAHPRCPIVAPSKKVPLRWVKGISLFEGTQIWLPAVMVYMHIPAQNIGERFWFPISTGCAAHSSFEQALLGAICEVIERDALSLTWLQKMQLPRLELDSLPLQIQHSLECFNKKSSVIEHIFFDATTDIGIPTIYSLQLTPYNEKIAALVMCSTGLDSAHCVARVIEESSASRLVLQSPVKDTSKHLDDFIEVVDGARYMGNSERLSAFDFLIQSPYRRRLSDMPTLSTDNPSHDLFQTIQRLHQCGMNIFAVDLSTDETVRTGIRVVRVIIPELQPLSFSYRARFLGHPRLYQAPQQMGQIVHSEAELNSWPQPFA